MRNMKYQMEVMGVLGYTIVALQRLESVVAKCWLAFSRQMIIDGKEAFVVENVDDLLEKNERKTLGHLLADMKKSGVFKGRFEKRFQKFVDNRNRLVHIIFKEKRYTSLDNRQSLGTLHRFITSVFKDAVYFQEIFDTYLGMMYEILYDQEGLDVLGIDKLRRVMRKKEEQGKLEELFRVLKW